MTHLEKTNSVNRTVKIIHSCITQQQFENAAVYAGLYAKSLMRLVKTEKIDDYSYANMNGIVSGALLLKQMQLADRRTMSRGQMKIMLSNKKVMKWKI